MDDPSDAFHWLDVFNIWPLSESPILATGHTFQPDAELVHTGTLHDHEHRLALPFQSDRRGEASEAIWIGQYRRSVLARISWPDILTEQRQLFWPVRPTRSGSVMPGV